MGIPVEGGKTRDPRQKGSDGVDDDTQPRVSMLYIYFLSMLTSNSLIFSKQFVVRYVNFGLSFFNYYIFCLNQKASNPVRSTIMNKYFFFASWGFTSRT